MARKMPLSPDTSYMLGLYRCGPGSSRSICLQTDSNMLVERFVRIAVMELGTKTYSIAVKKTGKGTRAEISNSKLKKLMDKALSERDRLFRYRNEYSGSYFGAIFDCSGGTDGKRVYLDADPMDAIILERLGFHTGRSRGRCYIRNSVEFIEFISPFSIAARLPGLKQESSVGKGHLGRA